MPFTLTSPLPSKGVAVPVQATFTEHKRIPYFPFATNSLSPHLRLFEDKIEFNVLYWHCRKLGELELVDAFSWKLNKSVVLSWKNTPWTFTAGLIVLPRLVEVLRFFARKNIALSPRARRLLDESNL